MKQTKGVIEYRFNKDGDKSEKAATIRYNNLWQMIIALIRINLKRADIIINHKNK